MIQRAEMKFPLISLVMPTMNSAEYIGETLFSLAHQKYTPFELIVVDGGSTDNTLDIVEQFNDGTIRVIELAPKLGIAKALNAGIEAAQGDFIARMDADDIAYEWRLNDQVFHLLANPEVDMVGTGVDAFGEHEGVFRSPLTHADIRNEFLVNNPFFHPTVMVRRRIADSGLFRYDESHFFEEDYELWGRLIPQIICNNLDQSSIRYRIRGNSTQWDPRKYRYKRHALLGFCQSIGLDDDTLIDALAEFQSGGFIRYDHYVSMREYALSCEDSDMPRLGWLHHALTSNKDYSDFTSWFRRIKGWSA